MSTHEVLYPAPPAPGSCLPENWAALLDFWKPLAHARAHEHGLTMCDCGAPITDEESGCCPLCFFLSGHHGVDSEWWERVCAQLGIPDAPERRLSEIVNTLLGASLNEDIGSWYTRRTIARIDALKSLSFERIEEVMAALDALEAEWRERDGAR